MGSSVPLKALKNKITTSIKQDAPKNRPKNSRRVVSPKSLSVEDMWRLEEAYRAIGSVVSQLPPREAAIWDLATQDLPYAEIAMRLYIAEGTVKSTVSHVRKKLRDATSA
jgi:RNA polymerase sigma factor (sigma-70 family)